MKQTTRRVFQRHNIIKEMIFNFFFLIASRPRLLLEVFIRENMGRRYFRISSAITVFLGLVLIPYICAELRSTIGSFANTYYQENFWTRYWSWYLFTALFVFFCLKRIKETYKHGNVYDYDYYSLSSGYSLPVFENPPFLSKKPSGYLVEVLIEPAFFFGIGLFLDLLHQSIGSLLEFCSICYGFSYAAAYYLADEKIQDKIDAIIVGEEFESSFVNGFEASRGVKNFPRPSNEDLRQKMASQMYPPQNEPDDAEFTVL